MSEKNAMARISIDIPAEFHKRLKAKAALSGQSMRQIILDYLIYLDSECDSIDKCLYSSHIPNKETIKAIKESRKRKDLIEADNIEDLFKKLNMK